MGAPTAYLDSGSERNLELEIIKVREIVYFSQPTSSLQGEQCPVDIRADVEVIGYVCVSQGKA